MLSQLHEILPHGLDVRLPDPSFGFKGLGGLRVRVFGDVWVYGFGLRVSEIQASASNKIGLIISDLGFRHMGVAQREAISKPTSKSLPQCKSPEIK